MADVTRTDNIGMSRAGDIKKARDVAPVKKVTKKRGRLTLRERPSAKKRRKTESEDDQQKHIDVYA